VVAALGAGGWAIVHARAGDSGTQPIALATISGQPSVTPSTEPTKEPERTHWTVAKLTRRIPVYDKPRSDARIRMYLPARTDDGQVARVCLVRRSYEYGGQAWYNVYLGTKPNGSRGWISEKGIALYPVYSRILIDTSRRKLTVIGEGGKVLARFPVCVGTSSAPTPVGEFFVSEKIAISPPSPGYGVLALAISAFSTESEIQQLFAASGGQVAIHGTSEVTSIGQALSHGCVRLYNKDILAVSKLVVTGSPVTIRQ
jgi:lipoprotein-anchoring transpeptidase ErfK/SrfK